MSSWIMVDYCHFLTTFCFNHFSGHVYNQMHQMYKELRLKKIGYLFQVIHALIWSTTKMLKSSLKL